MIRATTPTHQFTFPSTFDMSSIGEMLCTYSQNGNIVLEKEKIDFTFSEQTASVTLTQAETKKFIYGYPVSVQVRVLTPSGVAMASTIMSISLNDVLNDEVMV